MTFKTLTAAALVMIISAPAAFAEDAYWYYDAQGNLLYSDDADVYDEDDTYYDDDYVTTPSDDIVTYYPYPHTQSVISSGPAGTAVIAQSGGGSSAVISQSTGGLFFGRQPTVSIDSPAGSIRLGQQPSPFWHW